MLLASRSIVHIQIISQFCQNKIFKYRITNIIRCTLFMAQALVWTVGKESCRTMMGKCMWGKQMNEIARDHTNKEQPGCFPLHCGCIHTLWCTLGFCNISSLAKLYLKVYYHQISLLSKSKVQCGWLHVSPFVYVSMGKGYFGFSVQLSWTPYRPPSWESCFTVKDRVVCH